MTDAVELKITGLPDSSHTTVTDVLKKRHYRVRVEQDSNAVEISADKHCFSASGTLLVHLSLVLFVVGFLVGGFLGFRETGFVDNLKYKEVLDLFTEDASVEIRDFGVLQGKEGISDIYINRLGRRTARTEGHFVIEPDITVEGENPKGTGWFICYFLNQWWSGCREEMSPNIKRSVVNGRLNR